MVKYDILPSIHLRVPNKNETLENIDKDGIALHIDPFDLGLRLSLPDYRVFLASSAMVGAFWEEYYSPRIRGLYQLKKPKSLCFN